MADFYQVLSVSRTAAADEIKRAYRKLAMQHHPDRNNGSKEAEERFKLVTEAYDVLSDEQKRAHYDRFGEAGLKGAGGGFHHVDLAEALDIFMRQAGAGGGFAEMFGGGGGQRRDSRTGSDAKVTIPLTLGEVAAGAEKTFAARLLEPCDKCAGSGAEPGSQSKKCPTCGGSGDVRRAQRSLFGQFVSIAPCPTCSGEGSVVESPCKKCKGDGRVRGEATITITVPAGVTTGQYMSLRGKGNSGPRGGPRGDILVVFDVQEDDRFERDGEDLYCEIQVTYPQLVLGADLTVPGVTGTFSLRIPSGTQSGQVFHVRGRGLPRVNAAGTGDLHVRVQLWTPQDVGTEEATLIRRLAEVQASAPAGGSKGFWSKMRDVLGA